MHHMTPILTEVRTLFGFLFNPDEKIMEDLFLLILMGAQVVNVITGNSGCPCLLERSQIKTPNLFRWQKPLSFSTTVLEIFSW